MFNLSSDELKNKKVKMGSKVEIEPHEILLDKLAQKKEAELGISEQKFEVPLPKIALEGFFIFGLILFFLLFAKTVQLQVIENENLLAQSEENKFAMYQIQAERGVIYDRNLNQLVFNLPSFDLVVDTRNLPESETEKLKVLKEVSQILNLNLEELENKIKESETSLASVSENLSHQTLIILETKIGDLPGFKILNNTVREYKDGEDFAHLIGYTGKIRTEELREAPEFYSIFDYVGRDGLEKSYETTLRKNPGKLQIEKDVLGKEISSKVIQLPEPGKNLVLWLDTGLQKKIKEELERELKNVGSKKGVAVALDPKTGGVLALVSLPSFDNNLFQGGSDPKIVKNLLQDPLQPLFNQVISGTFPTGSTIKPLTASAALEEKIISPEKKIYCPGFIEVQHQYNPEIIYKYLDWTVHGWVDMRKAIAESCNVYFYTIGGGYGEQEGLGPTRIKNYLSLFGWGQKTGIDLPGEAKGLLPDPSWKKEVKGENWWDGDTYHLSIGQGDISVSPLQVAAAFSAIANGGKLFQPQVVQKIIDGKKNVIEEIEPEIIRENFIDPENLQIVREGMRGAVFYGSSAILGDLAVKAAAKTGTAETSKEGIYHNWITVFAPYEDPQIVLTIMIEDVEGMQPAAARVAKPVLEWYFGQQPLEE
jgi:penicillin-binding protein 2